MPIPGRRRGRGTGNPGKPGKRLRLEDLQGQFGVGLKEAANRLGICPTTLKARAQSLVAKRAQCKLTGRLVSALCRPACRTAISRMCHISSYSMPHLYMTYTSARSPSHALGARCCAHLACHLLRAACSTTDISVRQVGGQCTD